MRDQETINPRPYDLSAEFQTVVDKLEKNPEHVLFAPLQAVYQQLWQKARLEVQVVDSFESYEVARAKLFKLEKLRNAANQFLDGLAACFTIDVETVLSADLSLEDLDNKLIELHILKQMHSQIQSELEDLKSCLSEELIASIRDDHYSLYSEELRERLQAILAAHEKAFTMLSQQLAVSVSKEHLLALTKQLAILKYLQELANVFLKFATRNSPYCYLHHDEVMKACNQLVTTYQQLSVWPNGVVDPSQFDSMLSIILAWQSYAKEIFSMKTIEQQDAILAAWNKDGDAVVNAYFAELRESVRCQYLEYYDSPIHEYLEPIIAPSSELLDCLWRAIRKAYFKDDNPTLLRSWSLFHRQLARMPELGALNDGLHRLFGTLKDEFNSSRDRVRLQELSEWLKEFQAIFAIGLPHITKFPIPTAYQFSDDDSVLFFAQYRQFKQHLDLLADLEWGSSDLIASPHPMFAIMQNIFAQLWQAFCDEIATKNSMNGEMLTEAKTKLEHLTRLRAQANELLAGLDSCFVIDMSGEEPANCSQFEHLLNKLYKSNREFVTRKEFLTATREAVVVSTAARMQAGMFSVNAAPLTEANMAVAEDSLMGASTTDVKKPTSG